MKNINVILIICDELRADALGFMGNEKVRTPHIDSLAADSLIVEKAYCSSPMCCPSRASLATGRHPLGHGVYDNGLAMMDDEVSLYRILGEKGYRTANVGKWHINSHFDPDFGMDENISRIECEDQKIGPFGISDKELRRKTSYRKMPGDISLVLYGERPVMADDTVDTLYAEQFIKKIEEAEKSDTPSFLRLSILDPHSPYMPSKPYSEMYDYRDMELPGSFRSDLSEKPLMHRLFHKLRGFDQLEEDDFRKCKASYYGLVTHADQRVGKVLKRLRELDMYNDSLIVFTSDHGSMMGEHGYVEKWGYMYEEVSRIPFMIKFPQGENWTGRRDTYMENVDIMPTILDYLGIEIPSSVHGRSLLPYLKGEENSHREEVHGLSYVGAFQEEPALMIRDDKWKLTLYPGQEFLEKGLNNDHYLKYSDFFDGPLVEGELYHMENDPNEMNNLFCRDEFKAIREKYISRINQWKKSLGPCAEFKGKKMDKNEMAFFRLSQADMLSEANELIMSGRICGNNERRGRKDVC